MIRVLTALACMTFGATASAQGMNLSVQSDYPYVVQFEVFVAGSNRSYPGNGRVYELRTSAVTTYSIPCTYGERLRIGTWNLQFPRTEWGAGFNGDRGCQFCEVICAPDGPFVLRLTEMIEY